MNIVFIVPTGIGAEIGGHAGDATLAACLIGSVCDRIILHPNVVNASDINEMPANSLYIDGNMLDEFLAGNTGLQSVRNNKILVVVNPPIKEDTINAISACRMTLGVDIEIVILTEPLILRTDFNTQGLATGTVSGTTSLITQIRKYNFDALAILTKIETDKEIAIHYAKFGGVNPWGAVESIACRPISRAFKRPVAHAPIEDGIFNKLHLIVDPRMSAEFVSVAYLFCIIKGLHKAPRWTLESSKGLWIDDIDLLVSPDMTFGTPHNLCLNRNIPILVVEENKTILPPTKNKCIRVANYIEAAGYIACMRIGINPQAVRRPIKQKDK